MLAKRRDKACADLHDHGMRTKMAADVGCDISPLPGRCLLMICAVSEALVMLEWIRTSYLIPNAASRWPVNSACSRPGSGKTIVTGTKGQSKTMYKLTENVYPGGILLTETTTQTSMRSTVLVT